MRCNSAYRLRYWNCSEFHEQDWKSLVAIVLTVYGLKHSNILEPNFAQENVAIVLTVYGIETFQFRYCNHRWSFVATAPTVYGIETTKLQHQVPLLVQTSCNSTYCLRYWNWIFVFNSFGWRISLQQCLPFTVLKLLHVFSIHIMDINVATVLIVYGIETLNTN